jgi:hypothetical protein
MRSRPPVAVSRLVCGPFAIYKHPHANGFVLIHLPSQAKIIELEMQNACKDAAEKFAALDLNWWTCIPEEVIGPDLQEMKNIHLRLKPIPWIASNWGRGTGERAPPVLSARIRALNPRGRLPAGPDL